MNTRLQSPSRLVENLALDKAIKNHLDVLTNIQEYAPFADGVLQEYEHNKNDLKRVLKHIYMIEELLCAWYPNIKIDYRSIEFIDSIPRPNSRIFISSKVACIVTIMYYDSRSHETLRRKFRVNDKVKI